ncbi:MAG: imidazole glycerol phosphate synthase subunit HisH [Bowdeniella nasicola]|nr:imidazole glycerol phosphate synthase subunit HisH [Bowdeniella nasicola]
MMKPKVAIVDYGAGNLHSVANALAYVGAEVQVTADFGELIDTRGVIVPGVGTFAHCMDGLNAAYIPRLVERRLAGGRAVLGICIGLQVMAEASAEDDYATAGMGQWPVRVERLRAPVVPHMGWTKLQVPPAAKLLAGMDGERMYFLHSYAITTDPAAVMGESKTTKPVATWAHHGTPFVAAIENGPLTAMQFHPEKSGDAGLEILTRWVKQLP